MRDRVYRVEAVIIRRSDFGEADRLLTILTPHGKRRVVAKGARKVSSRLAGHIELFTRATLLLAVGRNLDIVTQSAPIERYERLRADLERISAAYYVAELVDRLIEEEDENRRAYELLAATLRQLDSGGSVDLALRAFELHLLDALGYRPQLQSCASCGEVLHEDADRFSPGAGGMLCPRCAPADRATLPVSLPAFKLLRYLQAQPLDIASQLQMSASTRAEAETLMRAYLRRILERDLRSIAFLEEVRLTGGDPEAPGARASQRPSSAQGDDHAHH